MRNYERFVKCIFSQMISEVFAKNASAPLMFHEYGKYPIDEERIINRLKKLNYEL